MYLIDVNYRKALFVAQSADARIPLGDRQAGEHNLIGAALIEWLKGFLTRIRSILKKPIQTTSKPWKKYPDHNE